MYVATILFVIFLRIYNHMALLFMQFNKGNHMQTSQHRVDKNAAMSL